MARDPHEFRDEDLIAQNEFIPQDYHDKLEQLDSGRINNRQFSFEQLFRAAVDEAQAIFDQRDVSGRNEVVDLPGMFLNDPGHIAWMVYMKASRAMGMLKIGNLVGAREEFIDMLNYGAFGVALIDLLKSEQK